MVKISKPMGAGKVSTYYKIEFSAADQRYYREGEKQLVGVWHGRLAAEKFGLAGGVAQEHYERMALGQYPHTAEQLIKHKPQVEGMAGHLEHIAAWDMTLAPSKSYSAAAFVGGDRHAHGAASEPALVAGNRRLPGGDALARLGGIRIRSRSHSRSRL